MWATYEAQILLRLGGVFLHLFLTQLTTGGAPHFQVVDGLRRGQFRTFQASHASTRGDRRLTCLTSLLEAEMISQTAEGWMVIPSL